MGSLALPTGGPPDPRIRVGAPDVPPGPRRPLAPGPEASVRPPSRRERIAAHSRTQDAGRAGGLDVLAGIELRPRSTLAGGPDRVAQPAPGGGHAEPAALRSDARTLHLLDQTRRSTAARPDFWSGRRISSSGLPGVGKTHLAISLAISAAENGRKISFLRPGRLPAAAGRLDRRLKTLTHPALTRSATCR